MRIVRDGYVPNDGLREMFVVHPMTAGEVAARCGWYRANGDADATKVKRCLGINPSVVYRNGEKKRYPNEQISEKNAKLIAEAMGFFPVECGF